MLTICETVGKVTVRDTVGKAMVAEAGVSTDALLLAGDSIEVSWGTKGIKTVREMDSMETNSDGGVSSVTNWSPSWGIS